MRRNVKCQASVLPALCIALTVLAALLLVLLEGARYYGLKEDAKEFTNLAEESLFAGYQPYLFERYGLFFLDGSFGTGEFDVTAAEDEMTAVLYENLMAASPMDGGNGYRMEPVAVQAIEYRLATDENGKVFERLAAERMKEIIGMQAAKRTLEKILDAGEKKETSADPEQAKADADAILKTLAEQAKSEGQENADGKDKNGQPQEEQKQEGTAGAAEVKNPLDTVKEIKKKGILSLVLPKDKTVSEKETSLENCLMKRSRETGNYRQKISVSWYERILMQEFLKNYAKNAVLPDEEGALSYGTEYLICGKGSDKANLKQTVNSLLLLREAFNFLYLQTDQGKSAEALTAATAVAGAFGNPAAIPVVQQGILAAWAYVESLCDVKALLAGGKIPLMKDAACFQTSLSGLWEALEMEYKGEARGLSYEKYLDILLYEKTEKQLAYRGMDLMEWNLQREASDQHCRMDHMITGLIISAEYQSDPLFLGGFGTDGGFRYHFLEKAEYHYGK